MTRMFLFLTAALLLVVANSAWSADREPTKEQIQTEAQNQELIYGSELMTPQERAVYRERIRAATSLEERQKVREQHHEQMQERARAQGLTLPEEPPEHGMGKGLGRGAGMGGGMGSGRNF